MSDAELSKVTEIELELTVAEKSWLTGHKPKTHSEIFTLLRIFFKERKQEIMKLLTHSKKDNHCFDPYI